VVAALLVVIGAVVVVVPVVSFVVVSFVVVSFVVVSFVVALVDPVVPDVVVTTALAVVPGSWAATAVAIPAVPMTAPRAATVVVRRTRRATTSRPLFLPLRPPSRPTMASSFRGLPFVVCLRCIQRRRSVGSLRGD
jgi:hypothetical protein